MAIAKPQDEHLFDKIREELFCVGIIKTLDNQVKNAVTEGQRDITITGIRDTLEYGAPQQMGYTVLLKKYNDPNLYHAHAIEAEVLNDPSKSRRFNLNEVPFRLDQIQNLLNGRSLRKPEFNRIANKIQNSWYQIDYSQKDHKGQHKLTVVPDKQVSMIKSSIPGKSDSNEPLLYDVLGKYPLKENLVPEQRMLVILDMLRGEAVPVKILTSGSMSPGYMQFGDQPGKMELMMEKNGKLVKLGPDLRELKIPPVSEQSLRRKGRSI